MCPSFAIRDIAEPPVLFARQHRGDQSSRLWVRFGKWYRGVDYRGTGSAARGSGGVLCSSRNFRHWRELVQLTPAILDGAVTPDKACDLFANKLVVVQTNFSFSMFGIKAYHVVGVLIWIDCGARNAIAIWRQHNVDAIVDHFVNVKDAVSYTHLTLPTIYSV